MRTAKMPEATRKDALSERGEKRRMKGILRRHGPLALSNASIATLPQSGRG